MINVAKTPWYIAGLHFNCTDCGNCCSGPESGYIWATAKEIDLIANYLKMSVEPFRKKYTRRLGNRTTLLENPTNKDCVFLQPVGDKKRCLIYPVRPNQCRTWPFWSSNLANSDSWNHAAMTCPGINRGNFHSCEQIESIKVSKRWWYDE
jgi:uncharacterized protein